MRSKLVIAATLLIVALVAGVVLIMSTSSSEPTGVDANQADESAGTSMPQGRTPGSSKPVEMPAYVTGYSWFDNTPPGSSYITEPVLHKTAGGTGTYADPITVAVGHTYSGGRSQLDWPRGTRFYIPSVRRYFIVEDVCGDGSRPQNGPCHVGYPSSAATWLDLWVGGRGRSDRGVTSCMNAITNTWKVIMNPPSNYAVVPGDIYGPAGCTRLFGNTPTKTN